jgi:hypothetical protein
MELTYTYEYGRGKGNRKSRSGPPALDLARDRRGPSNITPNEIAGSRLYSNLTHYITSKEDRYRLRDEMLGMESLRFMDMGVLAACLSFLRDVQGVVSSDTLGDSVVGPYIDKILLYLPSADTAGLTGIRLQEVRIQLKIQMVRYMELVRGYREGRRVAAAGIQEL